MLVSLSVSVSGDVESSNSWDSSLACPHPSPSFLNNFLQSESFMDCKHLHLLQIICDFFLGFIDIYSCKQGLIFLGFWSHVSSTTAVQRRYLFTLAPHLLSNRQFKLDFTHFKVWLWEIQIWFICQQIIHSRVWIKGNKGTAQLKF